MRHSHIHAPRQLADCAFQPSADPIERHIRPADWQASFVLWAVVVAVASIAFGVAVANAILN